MSTQPIEKVNLLQMFGRFTDQWSPKIVGEVNDTFIKLVKLEGEFVWHQHEVEDELFLVIKGQLTIELRDGEVRLDEGEFVVIPHGVEHRPVAHAEVWIVLIEPRSTLNTGDVRNSRTVEQLERL